MDPVERHGEPRQPHWITPARYRRGATECVGHQQDRDHHDRSSHPYERPNGVEPVCLHRACPLRWRLTNERGFLELPQLDEVSLCCAVCLIATALSRFKSMLDAGTGG